MGIATMPIRRGQTPLRKGIGSFSLRGLTPFGLIFSALFLVLTIPAFAAAPEILSPTGDQTLNEGQTLIVPFKVDELDNDVVDYFVEYLQNGQVQASLPQGAQLWQDPKTTERTFYWQTNFSQAGLHTFRFRARDDGGLEGSRTITVTVNNVTGPPAIQLRFNTPLSGSRPVPPGGKVNFEAGNAEIIITGLDPEGGLLTFTKVQGFPQEQFLVDATTVRWSLVFNYDFVDGSTREGIVAVTDNQGNRTEARIAVEYRKVFALATDNLFTFPFISITGQSGLVPTVRGTANLTLSLQNRYSQTLTPAQQAKVSLQYLLYANGDTVGKPISPALTGTAAAAYAWDTTRFLDGSPVPDGTHALSVRFFDADPENMPGLRQRLTPIAVDNVPEAVQGSQLIPITHGSHTGRDAQQGIGWVTYPGTMPHASHPLSYQFVAPARSRPEDPATWFDQSKWFTEPLIQGVHGHYEAQPLFYSTKDGHIYASALYQQDGPTAEQSYFLAERHPNMAVSRF